MKKDIGSVLRAEVVANTVDFFQVYLLAINIGPNQLFLLAFGTAFTNYRRSLIFPFWQVV
jgi:hypothetical protein